MGNAAALAFFYSEGRRLGLESVDEAEEMLYGKSGKGKRRPCVCLQCNRGFRSESALANHTRDVHNK